MEGDRLKGIRKIHDKKKNKTKTSHKNNRKVYDFCGTRTKYGTHRAQPLQYWHYYGFVRGVILTMHYA